MAFNIEKPIKKIGSVVLMGSLCATSIFSVRTFARDVYVNVDESTIHSVTFDGDVNNILGSVGVKVSDNDIVEKIDDSDGSLRVNIKRGFDVFVSNGIKKLTVRVVEGTTVSEVLKTLGIEVGPNDIVNLGSEIKLTKGMQIEIIQRVKIVLSADGQEKECFVPTYWSAGDVLNSMGISLSDEDSVNCDLSGAIYDGMRIEVSRMKTEEIVKTEAIPRGTVVKTSSLMDKGDNRVEVEGEDGEREIKIRQVVKDGEVIKSEVLSDTVVKKPSDKVIVQGTKHANTKGASAVSKESSPSPSGEVSNVFYGSATAYTASGGSRTATGNTPVEGETVAVDPRKIPYGSKILVETMDGSYKKVLTAQDTGGALRRGSAIADIYMNSTSSCRSFGRRAVKISVMK